MGREPTEDELMEPDESSGSPSLGTCVLTAGLVDETVAAELADCGRELLHCWRRDSINNCINFLCVDVVIEMQ